MTPVLLILLIVTLILLGTVVVLASISASKGGDRNLAIAAAVISGVALASLIAFAVIAYRVGKEFLRGRNQLASHLGKLISPQTSSAEKSRLIGTLQNVAAASNSSSRQPFKDGFGYDDKVIDILQSHAW